MPFLAAIPAIAAVAGAGASAAAGAGLTAATAVSLAATAAGGIASAVGAEQSASGQAKAADYQRQVALNNQQTANQNATLAQQQADAKVQAGYRAGAIKMGAQRAALAANGIDIDSGSAADVQESTASAGALQAEQDLYQGKLQGYGYQTQAGNFGAQAGLDSMQASNDGAAGNIGAASSILSSTGQFAQKWTQYGLGATPGYTGGTGTGVAAGVGGYY